ncbi:hypothetical protein [Mycobacterium helveticum]|uniref:Secreted protein n=1 Tax=Mycobacterium helveticum TaxID=2592811 RepID=A0A557XYK4_9MYCO|nr:hypothetical protein [Mycobacterium helveticum]TVS86675.1 hypothetical protein FPZ46_10815 [Mycobacterium helveticum]TVS91258.1 hypothetical protein FPZ47_05495 [Mycobacterium helveticum]
MSPSTVSLVAASLVLAAVAGPPAAAADPAAALPPLTSGGGSIIGGGTNAGVAQQLIDLADPDIQQGDGTDAANFINAAASVTNEQLAAPFALLRRGLSCQKDNAGFGARAYRRKDGQWGGAMLVAAKSVDSLKQCVMTNWRRASAGGEHAMCNGSWETPTNGDLRKVETYHILLAGTSADFCVDLNDKLKNNARGWP